MSRLFDGASLGFNGGFVNKKRGLFHTLIFTPGLIRGTKNKEFKDIKISNGGGSHGTSGKNKRGTETSPRG